MLFWIIAVGLSVVVAVALAVPLRQAHAIEEAAPDVAFYRGQLAEVEADRGRGLISAEEAERAGRPPTFGHQRRGLATLASPQ